MISAEKRLAIELAWWSEGTTLEIAQRLKTHSRRTVEGIWHDARAAGRLPPIARPKGGFPAEVIFQGSFRGFRTRAA